MLKDITIGRYIDTGSPLHSADARGKIIAAAAYAAVVVLCDNFAQLGVVLLLNALAVCISKIPIKYILKGLKPLIWFIVFTFAVNIFSGNGRELLRIGTVAVTSGGICDGAVASLKLIFFVTGTSYLTLTTPPVRLTDGLARLMRPLKALRVPTDDIAMIISIALRFIPTFADEAEKIMKAQRARGADFSNGTIVGRIRAIIPVTVPLFASVFRRADELSLAMDARCYGIGARRPRKKTRFCRRDAVLFAVMGIFCVLTVTVRHIR